MAQLPSNFEKDYLDLMQPIESDSTVKNRRNSLVASFAICSVYSLEKSVTDFRIFGLDLAGSNPETLLIIIVFVLLFWLLMFLTHSIKDYELNNEREALLLKHVDYIERRISQVKPKVESNSHYQSELGQAQSQMNIFLDQKIRLKKATFLKKVTFIAEYSLPCILTIFAIVLLVHDIATLKQLP
ncbi:hypothetical protein [Vibrio parahaemolyticus]|uniref:hypothetical protein n=1 Tax=Vibrio parahaemolyticus TaxID=670 RepID=UPI000C86D55D|nr:hypothetical protein [Vibrio parahaemolyticus]EIA1497222.1 hypothetical protein [Vibrio parahaemolyticus]ELA7323182.1 hypothetical protein [Vibrio parahaemolyticus]PMT59091.1 hypothetical protein C1S87_23115 [Vibrio parahaemolyticus]PMT84167.1 hypothetical protein C1S83_23880 [Vibrio parahaemolyticus]PMT85985.1 hypothetical protein C1T03_23680 [Vibrio parahaemolyticus]